MHNHLHSARRLSVRCGTHELFVAVMLLAIGWSVGARCVWSQQTPPAEGADRLGLEQKILSRMHRVNQMEMEAGRLAWEKGSTALIRSYGERLFRDHRFGDRKVTNLAEEKGITLVAPPSPAPKAMKQMMQKLQQARGEPFDRAFLKMMMQTHQNAIQTLRQAAPKLEDEDVQGLVTNLIPILGQHRTLAAHLQS